MLVQVRRVRGFVTTAIERSIASADGVEYVESKSLLGLSLVTARLKLNYDPTKALADITAKVNEVRNELPVEAEVPSISVQSADSQFAAVYLRFSSDTLSRAKSRITWCARFNPAWRPWRAFSAARFTVLVPSRCAFG